MDDFSYLKLENQLCFPLYVAAKEVVRKYTPLLNELGLTYTQYITMLVLWEKKQAYVSELGKILYLDSGTLTPLLKKLEAKGYICRKRDENDERSVIITLTKDGENMQRKAAHIPERIGKCIPLDPEEAVTLYALLYKIIGEVK